MSVLAQSSEPVIRWGWIADHLDDVWERTVEHVLLTVLAMGAGLVIASVLAAIALRFRRTYAPITWVSGLLYTVPSLALFGFLIPYTGLSLLTSTIALTSYTILILVRNIVAAIDGVPAHVREAAIGLGYTPLRRVLTVELPLAAPVIVAGIRVASVTVVGLVTVTSFVGYGGYGAFILDGLYRQFPTPIVLGTVLSVVLAVALDAAFVVVERALTPWRRGSAVGRRTVARLGPVAVPDVVQESG